MKSRSIIYGLISLSMVLNTSCYSMSAGSATRQHLDTKVIRKNEQIIRYQPVVRINDIDLQQKQLKLEVLRYPIVRFDEYRQDVYGKNNLGGTIGSGTLGYAIIAGLLLAVAFVPNSSGNRPDSATQQGLMYGAAATGGVAVIDLLLALIQFIPSTQENMAAREEEQTQRLEPLRGELIELKETSGALFYAGATNDAGVLSVPLKNFLHPSPDQHVFKIDFVLTHSNGALLNTSINFDSLREDKNSASSVLDKLNSFEVEQYQYHSIINMAKTEDLGAAITALQSFNPHYLLPEQVAYLKDAEQVWYKQQYDDLVMRANRSSAENMEELSSVIEHAKNIGSDSPYYRQLRQDIPNWVQKQYQQNFQLAYKFATEKKFGEAIAQLSTIPKQASIYEQVQKKRAEWQNLYYQQEYNQAYTLAKNKDFQQAFYKARQIPKTASIYAQAQKKAKEWESLFYHEIYLQAFRDAGKGELQTAIQNISIIPSTAKEYKQAQLKIAQWQKILIQREKIAQEQQTKSMQQAQLKEQERLQKICNSYYPGYIGRFKLKPAEIQTGNPFGILLGSALLAGTPTNYGFIVRYSNPSACTVTIEGASGNSYQTTSYLKPGELREVSSIDLKEAEVSN